MSSVRVRRIIETVAGLAALGVSALVYAAYRRDIRAARVRIASGSQRFAVPRTLDEREREEAVRLRRIAARRVQSRTR
jgi:hypothetical protein